MRFSTTLMLSGALLVSSTALANDVILSNGFETSDNAGYTDGAALDSVANSSWTKEDAGTANITADAGNGAESSDQFVRLANGAIINRDFADISELGTSLDSVWVEGYFRGTGSTTTLEDAVYPMQDASAIVHFSADNGIELADGDGTGGRTSLATDITSLDADSWYRVTIRLDFSAKAWDVYIVGNGQSFSTTGLGFVNDSVSQLNGFKNLAQDQADFDSFRVVLPIAGDANGDAAVDSSDVVALFDNMSEDPDPIIRSNSDLNGDSTLNSTDVDQLVDLLTSNI